jgi:hypothetical protein
MEGHWTFPGTSLSLVSSTKSNATVGNNFTEIFFLISIKNCIICVNYCINQEMVVPSEGVSQIKLNITNLVQLYIPYMYPMYKVEF